MYTKYTAHWDMETIYRGDTISGLKFCLRKKDTGLPIVPVSVCCQVRDRRKKLVHEYQASISSDGNIMLPQVDKEITKTFDGDMYFFDVEFTLQSGKVRTYLAGRQKVIQDTSEC